MKRIAFALALLACANSAKASTAFSGSTVLEHAPAACTANQHVGVGAVMPAWLTPRTLNISHTESFLFIQPGNSAALLLSVTGDFVGSATHTLKILAIDSEGTVSSTNTLRTAPLAIAAATESVTITGIIRDFGAAGCDVTIRGAFVRNPVDQWTCRL